ncbi:hypothetical protein DICPUDRAFT_82345 [Dictyostelium purpureum]|uniref:Transmembrane protein n=1 Tax=Dictyostelium purpureum TaxID=5786 RepID=F0ZW92_DICPU|nr:uncharacterized protein DICPUDRAFT_82345 [Dictyostelium purpureum]EGC31788.1 hypothetical protein DICPUDRAFT_82345 [Dictyostelium purpureum]|eukprot:XP_003291683.1 hypothetical protein DICPUDRAFT_82345 [Dictyostelium purpureum]
MLSFEQSQIWWRIGGILTCIAVGLDAYSSHGLPKKIEDAKRVEQFRIGSKYHILHSMALFLVPFSSNSTLTGGLFLAGITLFSGSLYYISLKNKPWFGRITPIGGLLLMGGWLSFAFN